MSTGRLVIVSNRVGDPRKPAAGGLAVALGDALAKSGGLWFGWSGSVTEARFPWSAIVMTLFPGSTPSRSKIGGRYGSAT